MGLFGRKQETEGIETYRVIYLGGHPDYPHKKVGAISFVIEAERFVLSATGGSKWFKGLEIAFADVFAFEVVPRQLGTATAIFGGLNSRQLNQANNIHITYRSGEHKLVLRLEMLSGMTAMGQAAKCREMIDHLRGKGILDRLNGASAPDPAPGDPLSQIAKLSELAEQGVLTREEFQAKKAELLARL